MTISTRGRYVIRVLIDLAEHQNGEYIPMKEVADRQEISLKYVEKLMPLLTKNGLIDGLHGKGGGYRLNRSPDQYIIGDILCITEGGLAPVACLEEGAAHCPRSAGCKTLSMWQKYYELTKNFFGGITVADLLENEFNYNYVI